MEKQRAVTRRIGLTPGPNVRGPMARFLRPCELLREVGPARSQIAIEIQHRLSLRHLQKKSKFIKKQKFAKQFYIKKIFFSFTLFFCRRA
jgi:hypothetical protein